MDHRLHLMPKVELHAHLNGSLADVILKELHRHKYGNDDVENGRYLVFEKELSMANCFDKFKYAHDLTDNPQRLAIATKRVIETFAGENTVYLELRSTPRGNESMTKQEYIKVICEAILVMGEAKPGCVVKYLPSIDRAKALAENEETIGAVLSAMDDYSTTIVGLDLSGNPSVGTWNEVKPILQKAKDAGLKLSIHCAEIADRVEETKAILESGLADRIGHGTFMDETPELWSLFAATGLLVECCLSSNVKCGTVAEFGSHHLHKLIRINNPIAICTDDCGVFDTCLTNEYEIAQKTFDLQVADLEIIVKDSLRHAFCREAEKVAVLLRINIYFDDKKRGES